MTSTIVSPERRKRERWDALRISEGFMPQQSQFTELQLMEMTVRLATSSKSEYDKRIHPKVGAVVARDGHVLSTGYRGEHYDGAHAEESTLLKLKSDEAIGATVYSTLEPCITRGKTPCSLLLIQRGITRLDYGMLDPNPDIRGQGEWLLEEHRVQIAKCRFHNLHAWPGVKDNFTDRWGDNHFRSRCGSRALSCFPARVIELWHLAEQTAGGITPRCQSSGIVNKELGRARAASRSRTFVGHGIKPARPLESLI